MHSNSILIIGATSTLARCTYKIYAENGYDLILAARDNEEIKADARDVEIRYGVRAWPVWLDAEDQESYQNLIDFVQKGLVGIISFLGYLGDQHVAESDEAERKRIHDVNYLCPTEIIERTIQYLDNTQATFIIGIGSVAGDRGRKGNYIYGAAKGALEIYFSGLRNRLAAANANVLLVKPGFIATKMTAHLSLPRILTASPCAVARDIYLAQTRKKDVVYSKWFWRYIMFVICLLPEKLFKRLSI